MKSQKWLTFLLLVLLLAACAGPTESPSPEPEENKPAAAEPTQAPEAMEEPAPESAAPEQLTDLDELVGIWRGRPAGGLLQINEKHQTLFAQTMDDLEGESFIPTMYPGSMEMDGSTLVFEDARCENEGPGSYEIFKNADGTVTFALLADDCTERVNNLVGQRVEPLVDIAWNLVTTEIPVVPPKTVTDLDELVGIWRGRPVGGLLQINEDHETLFAQTMDDLEGDSIIPTMYPGALSIEGSTVSFEDARCENEGPGTYEVLKYRDGTLTFALLADDCTNRVNNLVGQRAEPQVDITWNLVTRELPQKNSFALSVVRTIELPFIPHDIAAGADGTLYAVELGAPMVHHLDADGGVLNSWGGAGSEPGQFAFEPPPDGPPLDGGFIVVGADGNVYVSDSYNNRVQVFGPDGDFISIWESYGDALTPFDGPGPISADEAGNIYVADFSGLHQFGPDGQYISSMMAAGEVAFDSQGSLYTTVAFQNIAMKVPAGGGEPLVWGSEGAGDGEFITPMWVVVGQDDNLYVADHSGRVQAFDAGGNHLGSWSGEADSPFTVPVSLAIDAAGSIYAAPKDRAVIYVLGL